MVIKIQATVAIFIIHTSDPLSVPSFRVVRVTNSAVEYQLQRNDDITNAMITGYEVTHFGM